MIDDDDDDDDHKALEPLLDLGFAAGKKEGRVDYYIAILKNIIQCVSKELLLFS